MGGTSVKDMAASMDYGDVQGLVRFGHSHMTEACYLLVNVRNAPAARTWLANAPVTSAAKLPVRPKTALQIAFTPEGLQALGVSEKVVAGFSAEFISGVAGDPNRSRRLGDTGANSPSNWQWGGGAKSPHAVLMLFAEPGLLSHWTESIKGQFWDKAFEETVCLPTSDMGGREPFGFIDGISQPEIDWDQTRTVPINGNQRKYSNVVCLGEFLLGYANEYGRYTDRPLLDPRDHATSELLAAEDQPDKKDLGRNGTYVVMRQLAQDVRGFWQFLDRAANSNPEDRQRLGGLMVGRALADGAPLAPLSHGKIAGIAEEHDGIAGNLFTYDSDVEGTHCPYGAHIRRANPRNADIVGDPRGLISTLVRTLGFGNKNVRDDLLSSTRFHRVLRRGREYGTKLTPEEALQPAPLRDSERGLQFVAINSNIQRQFEFVQNAWMMRTKFDGLSEESDPLLGNRMPVAGCPFTNAFSIPQSGGVQRRLIGVPQFITVRGGAYVFLPSIRALRYLARLRD
jgi:deferrochelatase/peroxidase EfeB